MIIELSPFLLFQKEVEAVGDTQKTLASVFFCVGAQAFVPFTEDREGRKGKISCPQSVERLRALCDLLLSCQADCPRAFLYRLG